MKTKLSVIAMFATAVTMLVAACGGTQSDTSSEPVITDTAEVQSAEVEEVEEFKPDESADAIDFAAIDDADSALWSLMLRAEEAQGATRDALLTKVEDDLNTLTDAVLSAMDSSVANLDFGEIREADTAAWRLLLRATEAEELIHVAPVAQRIVEGLDQAAATLVTTADPNDADEMNSAIWSLNLRIEEAQELLDSSTD